MKPPSCRNLIKCEAAGRNTVLIPALTRCPVLVARPAAYLGGSAVRPTAPLLLPAAAPPDSAGARVPAPARTCRLNVLKFRNPNTRARAQRCPNTKWPKLAKRICSYKRTGPRQHPMSCVWPEEHSQHSFSNSEKAKIGNLPA
jgi:hypothetical protein